MSGFRAGGFRTPRQPAALDITPLIDCIFQLLIFFLLTASFVTMPNLGVELPRASAKPIMTEQRDLIVVVTRAGEIEFQGARVSARQLEDVLRRAYRDRPDVRVLVQADRLAHHGNVVLVMDVARSVGFRRLGVAIQAQ
jgi:biopolymer transport protein ExbD